jgi:Activator of Hsp90 ATPase homolog 1-like protein
MNKRVSAVTYIESAPEKSMARYSLTARSCGDIGSITTISDWNVGSPWRHEDFRQCEPGRHRGKMLESTPPRHLVLTWSFPWDAGNPEKISRVDFNIETHGDAVRLIVTHSELEPDLTIP